MCVDELDQAQSAGRGELDVKIEEASVRTCPSESVIHAGTFRESPFIRGAARLHEVDAIGGVLHFAQDVPGIHLRGHELRVGHLCSRVANSRVM